LTGATLSDALPLIPLLAAVTVVEPGATPEASPLAFTVATAGALDVQVAVEVISLVEPSL
jgi:hypothetical protein